MLKSLRSKVSAALGASGEDAAESMLTGLGWRIMDRNWRQGRLELDLVCEDGEELVFVEVRTRAKAGMVSPAETITPHKQRSLIKAASAYLSAHDAWERPCRFDVVCVTAGETLNLEHIRNAFEYSPALDRSHSSRQCW